MPESSAIALLFILGIACLACLWEAHHERDIAEAAQDSADGFACELDMAEEVRDHLRSELRTVHRKVAAEAPALHSRLWPDYPLNEDTHPELFRGGEA